MRSSSIQFIDETRHRWPDILLALFGLGGRTLSGGHCPCPMCGGKDRFRFDNKHGSGSWFCNRCGNGYGIHLVMRIMNTDLAHAMRAVEQVASIEPRVVRSAAKPVSAQVEQRRDEGGALLWATSADEYEYWVDQYEDRVAHYEERAAILEYDGGYSREEAETRALEEIVMAQPSLKRGVA